MNRTTRRIGGAMVGLALGGVLLTGQANADTGPRDAVVGSQSGTGALATAETSSTLQDDVAPRGPGGIGGVLDSEPPVIAAPDLPTGIPVQIWNQNTGRCIEPSVVNDVVGMDPCGTRWVRQASEYAPLFQLRVEGTNDCLSFGPVEHLGALLKKEPCVDSPSAEIRQYWKWAGNPPGGRLLINIGLVACLVDPGGFVPRIAPCDEQSAAQTWHFSL